MHPAASSPINRMTSAPCSQSVLRVECTYSIAIPRPNDRSRILADSPLALLFRLRDSDVDRYVAPRWEREFDLTATSSRGTEDPRGPSSYANAVSGVEPELADFARFNILEHLSGRKQAVRVTPFDPFADDVDPVIAGVRDVETKFAWLGIVRIVYGLTAGREYVLALRRIEHKVDGIVGHVDPKLSRSEWMRMRRRSFMGGSAHW